MDVRYTLKRTLSDGSHAKWLESKGKDERERTHSVNK
jgi:hypothetical protein